MNFNKWRNYLTEAKNKKEKETLEVEAEFDMDGKVISKDTSDDFIKGDEYRLNSDHEDIKGCGSDLPKSLVIEVPNDKADFVGVDPNGEDEYRKISAGTIKKCYTKVSADDEDDDKDDDDKDEKDDDKGKGENDEMMLGEMCGTLPPPEEPAVMMPKMTRKVVPHDEEGRMAKSQLYKIAKYAMEMMEDLHDDDELEGWVQAKITKAASYMSAAKHYLEYEYKYPPKPDMPMIHKVTPMDEIMPMMESTQKKVDEIIEGVIGSKKKSS